VTLRVDRLKQLLESYTRMNPENDCDSRASCFFEHSDRQTSPSSRYQSAPKEGPGLRARPPRPLRGVPAKEIRRSSHGIAPLLHPTTLRSMTGKALHENKACGCLSEYFAAGRQRCRLSIALFRADSLRARRPAGAFHHYYSS
jgi:hypothetical protein